MSGGWFYNFKSSSFPTSMCYMAMKVIGESYVKKLVAKPTPIDFCLKCQTYE